MADLKKYNLDSPEIRGILASFYIESKGMVVGSPSRGGVGKVEEYYDYEEHTLKYRRQNEHS